MEKVRALRLRPALVVSALLFAAVGWSTAEAAETIVLKPDRLKGYITDKTKVLILISPHNPTG